MADVPKNSPPGPEPGSRQSCRVDVFRAEELAAGEARLDAVVVRETPEGEPVARAEGLIRWAKKRSPRNPYRKLREWARLNERGFYSRTVLRRDAGEIYREYLAYVEAKRAEHEAATGTPTLSPQRLEVVTRIFYSPRTRAELARISPAVWASYHEDLETEARQENVA